MLKWKEVCGISVDGVTIDFKCHPKTPKDFEYDPYSPICLNKNQFYVNNYFDMKDINTAPAGMSQLSKVKSQCNNTIDCDSSDLSHNIIGEILDN